MALHWRPVGPEPEQTYWRRRAALAIALVLLLALLVTQLTGRDEPDRLGAEQPAPSAASEGPATPTTSPSASAPSESPSAPAAAPCPAAGLRIEATSDRDSYPVGDRPQLELRVTNTGSAPCTVDLGQAAVELLIFSGPDRIWSSDDCTSGAGTKPTTLQPGKADPTRLIWAGRRSLPGCKGPKAQALPGTYRISARVGDEQVEGGSFSFTG